MGRLTKEEEKKRRQAGYFLKYQQKTYNHIGMRFHKVLEKDLIVFLEQKTNKSDYIKNLIREDMKKQQEN